MKAKSGLWKQDRIFILYLGILYNTPFRCDFQDSSEQNKKAPPTLSLSLLLVLYHTRIHTQTHRDTHARKVITQGHNPFFPLSKAGREPKLFVCSSFISFYASTVWAYSLPPAPRPPAPARPPPRRAYHYIYSKPWRQPLG